MHKIGLRHVYGLFIPDRVPYLIISGFSGATEIEVDPSDAVVLSVTVVERNGRTVTVTDESRRFRRGEVI